MLPAISDKSYEERLSILKLPSLTYRRHRGDYTKFLTIILILIFLHYIHTPPPIPPGAINLNFLNIDQD